MSLLLLLEDPAQPGPQWRRVTMLISLQVSLDVVDKQHVLRHFAFSKAVSNSLHHLANTLLDLKICLSKTYRLPNPNLAVAVACSQFVEQFRAQKLPFIYQFNLL